MKGFLHAAVIAGLLAAAPARAQDAAPDTRQDAKNDQKHCEAPAYLTSADTPLSNVAESVKTRQKLDILVIGSASSVLPGPDGAASAYPAKLEASLRKKLNGITVNVAIEVLPKQTAEQVAEVIEKLATDRKPTLVVWQTGTVDAMRSVNPDDFRTALDEGVGAVKGAGADIILLNPQYSPRMETVISLGAYLDSMRVVAQQHETPLFDRFAIMRHWQDAGEFDLFDASRGLGLAKRVHDCLGRALSDMVIEAARINPAELRIQR